MDATQRAKFHSIILKELQRIEAPPSGGRRKPQRNSIATFEETSKGLDDIADFLADEIVSNNYHTLPPTSPDELAGVIGQHLRDLMFLNEAQADIFCESLYDSLGTLYAGDEDDTNLDDGDEYIDIPPGVCAICDRSVPLTFHHLIPKSEHTKAMERRKGMTARELGAYGVQICRMCHTAVHRIIPDNRELADKFDSLDALLDDVRIQKWAMWASRQRTSQRPGIFRNRR